MEIPQKLKIELPNDPAIPKETKTRYQRDISTPMFITPLFTIAKIWKLPKCLSIHKWIYKM